MLSMYIHFMHIANTRIFDMYSKLLSIYIYNVAVIVLSKIFDITISFQSILANHLTIRGWKSNESQISWKVKILIGRGKK